MANREGKTAQTGEIEQEEAVIWVRNGSQLKN
jgi:hypothetical protein